MVPFANRVAGARFAWMGRRVKLPHNFQGETCAIHGFSWQSQWVLDAKDETSCSLSHEWPSHTCDATSDADVGWPWAYRTEQHFRLGPEGCLMTLSITNRSGGIMPAGLGFHPYFRRRPESLLTFGADRMFEIGPDLIPNGKSSDPQRFADFTQGAKLPDILVDNCFSGWEGVATLEDDLGTIEIATSGASHLHLYSPPKENFLCLEPVSHLPDALNQFPADVTVLHQGQRASMTMQISFQPG